MIFDDISAKLQAGKAKDVQALVQQAIDEGYDPQEILEKGLVEGMNIIGEKNILARDVVCSDTPINQPMSTSSRRITLDASSSAVIHQIGGILNHTELVNGRHDSTWASTASAKKYLKRYAIQ